MAFCSNCGTARQENSAFCMNCGSKFEAVAVTQAPVQEAPPMPEWLNQPAEAPVSAPEAPPPVYAPPVYEAPPASSQAYIIPEKAPKKKKSPVKVIVVTALGLALAVGGFFGVDFLLNNYLAGGDSSLPDYSDDDRGSDRNNNDNSSPLPVDPPTTTTAPPEITTKPHIPTDTPAVDTITIWANNPEIPNAVERYQEMNPDSIVSRMEIQKVVYTDLDGLYEQAIEPALLAGGSNAPDLYIAEQAFALKYMQGDFSYFAKTYSDLGISDVEAKIQAAGLSQYAVDAGRRNGEVVGLRYDETAACFIYRRSIALNTWGTDDPAFVGAKIGPGWDRFSTAAAELKANGYAMVVSNGDLWQAARDSASQPWVVNDRLVIDPARLLFMDVAKEFYDNEYVLLGESMWGMWNDTWFRAMMGETTPEVFGYIGPFWLLNYIIADNCGDTYGDWAVTASPVPWSWGGSWLLANKDLEGEKRAAVAELIEWFTLDTSETGFQYLFATGTLYAGSTHFVDMANLFDGGYTRKSIAPSSVVMSKADGSLDILSGQNMNEYYLPAAQGVRSSHWHEYDSMINNLFTDYCYMYYTGNMSKDEAIEEFKYEVQDRFGLYID